MAKTTLGAELQQLSHLLQALIAKETDLKKKDELREQLAKVLDSIQALVEVNVKAATAEYAKARKAIEKANGEVIEAMKDLAKVAETINTVAKVVDVLGKLAKAAVV